ncbi:Pex12 amino terminal region-domain-containing protein, partial [Mrakia frigida]|uniref:Pex12 amino terminal region-domain-containing protein n=1 Tax=Mrakia frigida TaxID=29902 RepID=UPI003FCC0CF7
MASSDSPHQLDLDPSSSSLPPPPPSSLQVQASSSDLPASSSAAPPSIARTMRVSQLDSSDLDEALVGMLGTRVSDSLDNFGPSFKIHFQPELYLLLNLLLYRYGMWNRLATPGAQLQNLKYSSTKWGASQSRSKLRTLLLLHLLLTPSIFPKYFLTRFKQYALSRSWPDLPRRSFRKRVWDGMSKLEDLGKLGELVGIVWFLRDGSYPSLLTRLLGLKLVPSQAVLSRMVSYEFMNRQLVWGSFAQFLPHLLPYTPYLFTPLTRLSHSLRSTFTTVSSSLNDPPPDYHSLSKPPPDVNTGGKPIFDSDSSATPEPSSSSSSNRLPLGPYASLPLSTCPLCFSRSTPTSSSSSNAPIPQLPSIPALPTLPPTSNQLAALPPQDEDDPNAIHVGVKADCWNGCEYCYFCLGEVLVREEEKERRRRKESG